MNNLNKDVYECSDDEIFNELAELFPVEKKGGARFNSRGGANHCRF